MELGYVDSPATTLAPKAQGLWGKRELLMAIAVGAAAFFACEFLLYNYYYGDPAVYQRYYDSLIGRDVVWAWLSQSDYLGSSELVYPVVAWIGSNASIERYILMAAFDAVMYAILFRVLRTYQCSPIFIALCLTNFYVIVLATSAERLKFAYIFLFLATLTAGRKKIIWLALAPLAHFQSLVTHASIFVWHFFAPLSVKVKFALAVMSAIGGALALYFFYAALIDKIISYQGRGGLVEILSGLALFSVAVAIFQNRVRVIAALAPLIVLTFILGSDRMNMVIFTTFAYICLVEHKTNNPVVLLIMAYFSFRALIFVDNILKYGNGFA